MRRSVRFRPGVSSLEHRAMLDGDQSGDQWVDDDPTLGANPVDVDPMDAQFPDDSDYTSATPVNSVDAGIDPTPDTPDVESDNSPDAPSVGPLFMDASDPYT